MYLKGRAVMEGANCTFEKNSAFSVHCDRCLQRPLPCSACMQYGAGLFLIAGATMNGTNFAFIDNRAHDRPPFPNRKVDPAVLHSNNFMPKIILCAAARNRTLCNRCFTSVYRLLLQHQPGHGTLLVDPKESLNAVF